MNNPIQVMKRILGQGINPRDLIINLVGRDLNSNSIFQDLIAKANSGDKKGVEEYARKFCKQRGIDYDKEIQSFMNNFR